MPSVTNWLFLLYVKDSLAMTLPVCGRPDIKGFGKLFANLAKDELSSN